MTLQEQLIEQLHKTLLLMEDTCPFEELHGEGLSGVIYRRYQNAFSALRDSGMSYGRRRQSLQFLISINRAYVGSGNHRDDDLREELMETDRLIDHYLNRE